MLSSFSSATALPIAAVERETGLAKDTLRIWERRYNFPQPLRDAQGKRQYPVAQVRQLQLIGRLLVRGLRPSKIVGLDSAALEALLAQHPASTAQAIPSTPHLSRTNQNLGATEADFAPDFTPYLQALHQHDTQALRHALHYGLMRQGLERFVLELVAPLTTAVADAWAQGDLEVFQEHLFTEVLTSVLRPAITGLQAAPSSAGDARPRVLLTTLPPEQHGLGLLMVQALLALEGCACISLGVNTPLADVLQAAQAHRADVVALSFSATHSGAPVLAQLQALRRQLPAATALWVGGACPVLYDKPLPGITASQPLTALTSLVAQWRSHAQAAPALASARH
ncbi:MAG: cobalamin-dependent protein [Comamonas sp.]|nr:cobalamin-dependent protein [Comamonas sp.]